MKSLHNFRNPPVKALWLFLAVMLLSISASAQKRKTSSPISGVWKYTAQSARNDFQQVLNASPKVDYESEYFIFEENNKFRHAFADSIGNVIRELKGKWKMIDNKIKIEYADVVFNLTVQYFFLADDLVLGQHFNHVIFSRSEFGSRNIAQK